MINKFWGFDTETVIRKKGWGGFPYTFQLCHGDQHLYYENPSLNPKVFRSSFIKTVDRYCEDGDVLAAYNLEFEIAVLFRDILYYFQQNQFRHRESGVVISGVASDPTPFLKLQFPKKKITVIDAAKFFGDGGHYSLDDISRSLLPSLRKLKRPKYLGQRIPFLKEEKYFREYSLVDAILCSDQGLGDYIDKYHKEAKLDEVCFSAAHLAGTHFNKNFCHSRKLDDPGNRIEGYAYWARFGGYRAGHGEQGIYENYCHVDLDSAYPWAMSEMKAYFNGGYYRTKNFEPEAIYKIETVLPKEDPRPIFQRRGRNKLEYQPLNTRIKFWTTGFEIQVYKRLWGKRFKFNILDGYTWRGQDRYKPLRAWALTHHKEKAKISKEDKQNGWKRDFHKAMLNHLTGKFDSSINFNKEVWWTAKGEIEIQDSRPGMLRNLFVASLLRGKVRARVWSEGCRLHSIQEMTDSMDIPKSSLKNLTTGEGLGKWGVECEGDLLYYRTGSYFYLKHISRLSFLKNMKLKKEDREAFHRLGKKYIEIVRQATHGIQTSGINVLKLILKGGGFYIRKKMTRVKESLRKDGGKTALRFDNYRKELKNVTTKLKKEFEQWQSKKIARK